MSAGVIVLGAGLLMAVLVAYAGYRLHRDRSPTPWVPAFVTLAVYLGVGWLIASVIDDLPSAAEAARAYQLGLISSSDYEFLRDQAVSRALIHYTISAAIALGLSLVFRSAPAPDELPEARARER